MVVKILELFPRSQLMCLLDHPKILEHLGKQFSQYHFPNLQKSSLSFVAPKISLPNPSLPDFPWAIILRILIWKFVGFSFKVLVVIQKFLRFIQCLQAYEPSLAQGHYSPFLSGLRSPSQPMRKHMVIFVIGPQYVWTTKPSKFQSTQRSFGPSE